MGAVLWCGAGTAAADETRSLTRDAAPRLAAERNAALMVSNLERACLGAVADTARRPYLPEITIETAAKESSAGADKQRSVDTVGTLSYASPYGQTVSVAGTLGANLTGSQQPARSLTIEVSQALPGAASIPAGRPISGKPIST